MNTATFHPESVFGAVASDLEKAVLRALNGAHGNAVAAQVGSGSTNRQDPYGHTIKFRQLDWLRDEVLVLPGAERHPVPRAVGDFVRVNGVLLYPWRYASDKSKSRDAARMRMSNFRFDLLSDKPVDDGQLTLEQGAMDEAQLEAQLAGDRELHEQLDGLRRAVVIAYASGPHVGVVEIGWGQARLVDDSGSLDWINWSPLAASVVLSDVERPRLATAGGSVADASTGKRFDQEGADEGIPLSLRNPLAGPPSHEPEGETTKAGAEVDPQ